MLPRHKSNPELPENLRWKEYEAYLHTQAKSFLQLKIVEEIWLKAQDKYPNLRYPCAGTSEDGVYYLVWAFTDIHDITFSVEVEPTGLVSWFYRNRAEFATAGTEEEGSLVIPDSMYNYLECFIRLPSEALVKGTQS